MILYLQVLAFAAALETRKVTVSIRQTRGLDAGAACGQLRNEFQKKPIAEEESQSTTTEPQLVSAWYVKGRISVELKEHIIPAIYDNLANGDN